MSTTNDFRKITAANIEAWDEAIQAIQIWMISRKNALWI